MSDATTEAPGGGQLAFDTGGTFTDVIRVDPDGTVTAAKLLAAAEEVGDGVAGMLPGLSVSRFRHATTVVANALIEGHGASVGLITTRGFRDVLEMRGQRRPPVYDLDWDRLPPIVPRRLRREIDERVRADGSVDTPIDIGQVEQIVRGLAAEGVTAIGVCLINAYMNPAHERVVADVVREVAPSVHVTIGSDISRESGEYERTSTACVNASLSTLADGYLHAIEEALHCDEHELLVMCSHGGFVTSATARSRPVQMIESGPAAGAIAAWHVVRELDLGPALCLDMGGTTAKAALATELEPPVRPGMEVGGKSTLASRLFGGEGHALQVPSLDVVEVGAGGGSIAWVDAGSALRVGPAGAGARPGPACYARGGERATVTDANVVLGYVNPTTIAGGTVLISAALAAEVVRRDVALPLEIALEDAAWGIVQVADASMMRALRSVSVERGHDPRALSLIAYGGAGPLHAARLAESLGIRHVVIPPLAGLFSAVGLLLARYRYEAARSIQMPLAAAAAVVRDGLHDELEREARRALERGGVSAEGVFVQREADLRYESGGATITVGAGPDGAMIEALRSRHETLYGFAPDADVLLTALRVRLELPTDELALGCVGSYLRRRSKLDARPPGRRAAHFGAHGRIELSVFSDRSQLRGGVEGPFVVEEPDMTLLAPPGWTAELDDSHAVHLASKAAA